LRFSKKTRPDGLSADRLRHQFFVEERNLLKTWKCEYRYTTEEIEKMKAGMFREVHVSRDQGKKILAKVQRVINENQLSDNCQPDIHNV
jgi:hypothetical protein